MKCRWTETNAYVIDYMNENLCLDENRECHVATEVIKQTSEKLTMLRVEDETLQRLEIVPEDLICGYNRRETSEEEKEEGVEASGNSCMFLMKTHRGKSSFLFIRGVSDSGHIAGGAQKTDEKNRLRKISHGNFVRGEQREEARRAAGSVRAAKQQK